MLSLTNVYRTLRVCAALRRRGCRVLDAYAHCEPPVIRIGAPPAGAIATYGYLPPPPVGRVRMPVLCAAIVDRVRVEWCAREGAR